MAAGSGRVLTEYQPGRIWLSEYPIRYAGCRFNARMCVIRLRDGRLLIHSPCPLDEAVKAELDDLGTVAAIIAPGNFHWFNLNAFSEAFPDAEIYVCPGVEKKMSMPAGAKVLDDEAPSLWAGELDQAVVRGARLMNEVALFHRETATLILVDVIENFSDDTAGTGGLLRLWWGLLRMWDRAKPAPEYQMSWNDKPAARASFERILGWDFERIIIAHGDLIEVDAKEVARSAWSGVLGTG